MHNFRSNNTKNPFSTRQNHGQYHHDPSRRRDQKYNSHFNNRQQISLLSSSSSSSTPSASFSQNEEKYQWTANRNNQQNNNNNNNCSNTSPQRMTYQQYQQQFNHQKNNKRNSDEVDQRNFKRQFGQKPYQNYDRNNKNNNNNFHNSNNNSNSSNNKRYRSGKNNSEERYYQNKIQKKDQEKVVEYGGKVEFLGTQYIGQPINSNSKQNEKEKHSDLKQQQQDQSKIPTKQPLQSEQQIQDNLKYMTKGKMLIKPPLISSSISSSSFQSKPQNPFAQQQQQQQQQQNPWLKSVAELQFKKVDEIRRQRQDEIDQSTYIKHKRMGSPRVGADYQATKFPSFKSKFDLPWNFSFDSEEKKTLKAKPMWVWDPKTIGHFCKQIDIEQYLNISKKLGFYYYAENQDNEQNNDQIQLQQKVLVNEEELLFILMDEKYNAEKALKTLKSVYNYNNITSERKSSSQQSANNIRKEEIRVSNLSQTLSECYSEDEKQ